MSDHGLGGSMDQFAAMLRDFIPVISNYRKQLEKNGFNPEEAFLMCRDLQKAIFTATKMEDGKGEDWKQ